MRIYHSEDLTGKIFNRLTVRCRYSPVDNTPKYSKRIFWICDCICGNTSIVRSDVLKRNKSQSCGCYNKDITAIRCTTHGKSTHPLYIKFETMKTRCYSDKHQNYHRYGGRGIVICDEWLNDFMKFYTWCIDNGWEDGLEIDRINNDDGYYPNNCRIVSRIQNLHNTPSHSNSSSKYKGVWWSNKNNKWMSMITCEGVRYYLGQYDSEYDASIAYNTKALELFGKYAWIEHPCNMNHED